MKVLQLMYKLPFPGHDGGEYSLKSSALGLSQQAEINLKILAMKTSKSDLSENFSNNKLDIEIIEVNTSINKFKLFYSLFQKESYIISRYYSKNFEKKIKSLIQSNDYDIIQLEHICLGVYIPIIKKYTEAKIIIREQNIEFKLWQSYRISSKNIFHRTYLQLQIKKLKAFEQKCLASSDGIIALTDIDSNEINNLNILVPKITIPIGYDFTNLNSMPQFKNNRIKFYHLGSMDWLPNIQGIDWFLKEIFPKLNLNPNNYEIHLAGKKMPNYFKRRSNSSLLINDKIKNAIDFINEKDVLIVPLLSGSGIRVKIIEALANRKTVISTTIGAQGIPVEESGIIIADTVEEFVFQIEKICNQPELIEILGNKGYNFAKTNYDNNILGRKMIRFYKSLI